MLGSVQKRSKRAWPETKIKFSKEGKEKRGENVEDNGGLCAPRVACLNGNGESENNNPRRNRGK